MSSRPSKFLSHSADSMKAVALVSGRALVMLFGINVNLNLVRPASTPSGNCRTCSVIALKLKQNIRFQVARMPDHLTHTYNHDHWSILWRSFQAWWWSPCRATPRSTSCRWTGLPYLNNYIRDNVTLLEYLYLGKHQLVPEHRTMKRDILVDICVFETMIIALNLRSSLNMLVCLPFCSFVFLFPCFLFLRFFVLFSPH